MLEKKTVHEKINKLINKMKIYGFADQHIQPPIHINT